jgi:hypothetical protein
MSQARPPADPSFCPSSTTPALAAGRSGSRCSARSEARTNLGVVVAEWMAARGGRGWTTARMSNSAVVEWCMSRCCHDVWWWLGVSHN